MLRRAVSGTLLRRRGEPRPQPRIRPRHARGQARRRPPHEWHALTHTGVDVARRHHHTRACGIRGHSQHRRCRDGGLPHRGRADVGHTIPPRSVPLDRRQAVAAQLRGRHLRMYAVVDLGEFRRVDRSRVARQAGRRQGGARALGRRRFVGRGRTAAQGHRRTSLLHLRPRAWASMSRAYAPPPAFWAT